MEEERARFEIAWRPQPEELVEIALGRRLRFARADGPDAPAAVARSGPVGAGFDALSKGRQPSRPTAGLRHARNSHEQQCAVAADETRFLGQNQTEAWRGKVG